MTFTRCIEKNNFAFSSSVRYFRQWISVSRKHKDGGKQEDHLA